jgi:hypothetical protein
MVFERIAPTQRVGTESIRNQKVPLIVQGRRDFFREGIRDGYRRSCSPRALASSAPQRGFQSLLVFVPASIFSLRSLLESLRLSLEPVDPSPTIDQAVNGGFSATIRAKAWIACLA